MLLAEIVPFGLVPALILLRPDLRAKRAWLMSAAALACMGVALNRFVLTIQTLAVPTLAFDKFLNYWPSWQEFGTFGAVIAFGVLVYSFSFRYLALFPQERDFDSLAIRRKLDSMLDASERDSQRS
jgi:molybdopterin-containing oxidoreductase family membrane subunit